MNTAEQKAKELVEKFKPYVYCYRGSGMLSNDQDPSAILEYAKACAVICVEEILKSNDHAGGGEEYWKEVLEEIKKL